MAYTNVIGTANTFQKDKDATLDYGFDWTGWLSSGEIIVAYTITLSASTLTKVTDSATSGSVIVWLSGGTSGSRYGVSCKITTDQNRIDERTIKIDVRER